MSNDDLYEQGMRVRREVLGDAHVDRANANATDVTEPWQEFITKHAWGAVWTRDGLDRRTRSVVTLSVLTALGRENEIAMHVRAALGNGLTREEIAEVFIHTAVYAGLFPGRERGLRDRAAGLRRAVATPPQVAAQLRPEGEFTLQKSIKRSQNTRIRASTLAWDAGCRCLV